ncbi:uncharacterized protein FOMMEDRAFT_171426 [Fomitiporia mediterranea MF3/22]|uniref:uncharacterized protein n=1 Tax=Fomitiporia mediterranea (strain MF3/22) TaxID=694068 RepID=UPI0004408C0A|nr:uncharacterized protein FOMMEDRAFT_171426 [Fomitiporia mediterranea MF3/22]EJC98063.1 hypothetical protein FOMMEDRAFT_171426 [Fomitiporia mediterranea MF3/22]
MRNEMNAGRIHVQGLLIFELAKHEDDYSSRRGECTPQSSGPGEQADDSEEHEGSIVDDIPKAASSLTRETASHSRPTLSSPFDLLSLIFSSRATVNTAYRRTTMTGMKMEKRQTQRATSENACWTFGASRMPAQCPGIAMSLFFKPVLSHPSCIAVVSPDSV